MDNVYTKSYLKDFLNKIYVSNLDNKQISDFLSTLVNTKKNQFDDNYNNYLILLILTCINKTNLTYQNQVLINEIISSLLLDQLVENKSLNNNNLQNNCCNDNNTQDEDNNKISLETLNLDDKYAVKKYFLQQNKHLDSNGNFRYPPKGRTAVITSGDNITIPGIRYIINYIIDSNGDIVGIQGFPKEELPQVEYEKVYSDLIDSIFKDEK